MSADRDAADAMTADEVIALLRLSPHPEGGCFRETFRDSAMQHASGGARSASTAIYFLLRAGEHSRWHRVDAAEIWHHYAGAALALDIAPPSGPSIRIRLGSRLDDGERPQAVVPAGDWQRARSLGAWTLVGCTVAPGFEFSTFEIAREGFEPC